jgi:fructokinase
MKSSRPQILVFGEVLFDCFPDGSTVLGGAPFNVAWNLQGLGAKPLFLSRVGDDALGDQIRAAMEDWKMETVGLQIDPKRPTGKVEVSFQDGEPSYEIVADSAYDFIEAESLTPPFSACSLAVHGTLALRGDRSRSSFESIMKEAGIPSFYDVNLRDPWWDRETVQKYLRRTEIVKLNEGELRRLVPQEGANLERALKLLELGPKSLCLTSGDKGAAVYSREGCLAEVEPKQTVKVVDTVGAGDAFASVFILGWIHGWELQTTMQRAQDFAGAVVGRRGATLKDDNFYRRFRESWGLS